MAALPLKVKPRLCFYAPSPSDWVYLIFLTCDNTLGVWFRKGQKVKKIAEHGPGAYLGSGGAPHFCCIYPGTQGKLAESLFDFALVWQFGGEFVHTFLYKKFGYVPCVLEMPCGACNTSCTITSSSNPCNVGDTVTFTVTITNMDGEGGPGATPEGTVALSNTDCGDITLGAGTPGSLNTVTVTCEQTFNTAGTYDIVANYTPEGGFLQTLCSVSQVVNSSGVSTSCCPNDVPEKLYMTVTGTNCTNTYELDWNGTNWAYTGSLGTCVSTPTLQLSCVSGSWEISGGGFVNGFGPSSVSCDPFILVFGPAGNLCCGSQTFTITS